MNTKILKAVLILCVWSSTESAQAQLDVGVQYMFGWGAKGTLVGDMQGYGFYGRYRSGERWRVTSAFHHSEYDLEEPITTVSLQALPGEKPRDAFVIVTAFEAGAEYQIYTLANGSEFFAGADLMYFLFDTASASGTTDSGQPFRITINAPNSLAVGTKLGYSHKFSERWHADILVRYAQAFSKWKTTEHNTGNMGEIAAYAPLGLTARVGFSF